MRLGGYFGAQTIDELEPLCEQADKYGLSAIMAPWDFQKWSDNDCIAYGEKARSLGFVIGETGYWENVLEPDKRELHIQNMRLLLRKADLMGVKCVVGLVGSKDYAHGASGAHPDNYTDETKSEFRDIVLKFLDGLDLNVTKYGTEPWPSTFYYQPEDILAFLQSVDHPHVGVHLDQMNMVNQFTYFRTTELINRTFDLLSGYIVSVHAKDVLWDPKFMFMKFDEVYPGDGVLDYDTFLKRLDKLDADMTVFCEHYQTEEQFVTAFKKLHALAKRAGVRFLPRGQ